MAIIHLSLNTSIEGMSLRRFSSCLCPKPAPRELPASLTTDLLPFALCTLQQEAGANKAVQLEVGSRNVSKLEFHPIISYHMLQEQSFVYTSCV